jgi:hypothetical protein
VSTCITDLATTHGFDRKTLGTWTQGGMTFQALWLRFLIRNCFGKIFYLLGFVLGITALGPHGELVRMVEFIPAIALIYLSYKIKK